MGKKHERCPTCGGQGYMYQTEAQLGGDYFREPPQTISQKVTCPRCGGAGKILKIIAMLLLWQPRFIICSSG